MFQIVHFQKILEGQCLNKNRLTAPLYILLDLTPSLLPKIGTYEPFVFGFKKPDFASLSHNFYGVAKFENKVMCS